MNPEQMLAHLKRLTATLSPRQLVTLGVAFVAVVGVVAGSAYWINAPSYSLLATDMDAESAQSVVAKLKTSKVAYLLEDGGRTIRVASDRVDDLRLELSSQGMPSAGRIGFEIFDRTAFGTTEFLEHVNYRRALEGELARTIATINDVQSARVHISMAKESLFASDAQQAKASVVLKLRDRKPLSASTISGITGLVAASVESLRPESVIVLDTFGRPLSRQSGDGADANAGLQLDAQRQLEHDLSAKVVSLLEPLVGVGHARVNVTARLDGNSLEETDEQWDPTTVLRSRQMSMDAGGSFVGGVAGSGGAAGGVGGIAGARANAPQNLTTAPALAAAPASPVTSQGPTRSTENTSYEVSRKTLHRISPRGQVARLSVAVVLDDDHPVAQAATAGKAQSKPRSAEDLKRIEHLVATSVGLDADRGDEVTVENIAFADDGSDAPLPTPTVWQRVGPLVSSGGALFEVGRILAVLGLAVFAFLAIIRPMAANALKLPAAVAVAGALGPGQAVATVAELESQIEADLDAAARGPRRLNALTKRLGKTAEQEPEQVARLVRSLLTDGDR
ncbi:MAG: flagellar basal-body MS-ring/collar protein FliF [Acidobacteriota bacterium]